MEYKGFRVVPLGTFPMFSIKNLGSGILAKSLRGTFTDTNMAFRAIDAHLSKRKSNGKTESGGKG